MVKKSMYFSNILNRDLQEFHLKNKVTDIFNIEHKPFLKDDMRYFPLFYFDEIINHNQEMRVIDNKYILNPEYQINAVSDDGEAGVYQKNNNMGIIKGISDSLSVDEFNYLVYCLRSMKNIKEDIRINNSLVTGEFGDYNFEFEDYMMSDEGIIILDETITEIGNVTLLNPQYKNANYILTVKILSYGVNIGEKDKNIISSIIEIPLTANTPVPIIVEELNRNNIVSFNATVSMDYSAPVIDLNDGLSLTIDKDRIYLNDSVTLTATYTNYQSPSVEGVTVEFVGKYGYIGTAVTDENGEATLTYTPLNEGNNTFYATTLNVESNRVDTYVYPAPTPQLIELTGVPEIAIIDDECTPHVYVEDVLGNPLINANVTLHWDNIIYNAVTDNTGQAVFNVIVSGSGLVDCYSNIDNVYSETLQCRVLDENYQIATNREYTIELGESVNVVGRVYTYNSGGGIVNAQVTIEQNGTVISTHITDSQGVFETIITPESVGTFNYEVYFNGTPDIGYYHGIARNWFSIIVNNPVEPASVVLTGDKNVLSAYDSDYCTLSATVLDGDNNPISGETVTFKQGSIVIGTGVTNNNGVATYTYAAEGVGNVSFTASCRTLLSETYVVKDCIKAGFNGWKGTFSTGTDTYDYIQITGTGVSPNITLPSAFEMNYKFKNLNTTDAATGSGLWIIGTDTNNGVLIGHEGTYRRIRLYSRSNGTNTTRATQDYVYSYQIWTDAKITYENGTITMTVDGKSISYNLSSAEIMQFYTSYNNMRISEWNIKPL